MSHHRCITQSGHKSTNHEDAQLSLSLSLSLLPPIAAADAGGSCTSPRR